MPVTKERIGQYRVGPIGVNRFSASTVGSAMATVGGNIADVLYPDLAKYAHKRGEEAALSLDPHSVLTINPDTGAPVVLDRKPFEMGGIASRSYAGVVDKLYQNGVDSQLKAKSKEYASKYPNPDTYRKMYGQFVDDMAAPAIGHWRGYVANAGSAYLAATEAHLRSKQAAAGHKLKSKEYADMLNETIENVFLTASGAGRIPQYRGDPALEGELVGIGYNEGVDELVDSAISDAKEANSAGLISDSGLKAATKALKGARQKGLLSADIAKLSPSDRLKLEDYALTGGADPSLLPESFTASAPFIDPRSPDVTIDDVVKLAPYIKSTSKAYNNADILELKAGLSEVTNSAEAHELALQIAAAGGNPAQANAVTLRLGGIEVTDLTARVSDALVESPDRDFLSTQLVKLVSSGNAADISDFPEEYQSIAREVLETARHPSTKALAPRLRDALSGLRGPNFHSLRVRQESQEQLADGLNDINGILTATGDPRPDAYGRLPEPLQIDYPRALESAIALLGQPFNGIDGKDVLEAVGGAVEKITRQRFGGISNRLGADVGYAAALALSTDVTGSSDKGWAGALISVLGQKEAGVLAREIETIAKKVKLTEAEREKDADNIGLVTAGTFLGTGGSKIADTALAQTTEMTALEVVNSAASGGDDSAEANEVLKTVIGWSHLPTDIDNIFKDLLGTGSRADVPDTYAIRLWNELSFPNDSNMARGSFVKNMDKDTIAGLDAVGSMVKGGMDAPSALKAYRESMSVPVKDREAAFKDSIGVSSDEFVNNLLGDAHSTALRLSEKRQVSSYVSRLQGIFPMITEEQLSLMTESFTELRFPSGDRVLRGMHNNDILRVFGNSSQGADREAFVEHALEIARENGVTNVVGYGEILNAGGLFSKQLTLQEERSHDNIPTYTIFIDGAPLVKEVDGVSMVLSVTTDDPDYILEKGVGRNIAYSEHVAENLQVLGVSIRSEAGNYLDAISELNIINGKPRRPEDYTDDELREIVRLAEQENKFMTSLTRQYIIKRLGTE